MARKFEADKLVIASHNKGKVVEIQDLLQPFGVQVVSAGELGLPEPEENGETFIENSLIKSHSAALASGLPALADDSGLAVDLLGGAPGIYSARWAGPTKSFTVAMQKVNEAVREYDKPDQKADRTAHFLCALSLAWPDGHAEFFEGKVTGQLVWPPRGDHGFGYDPMFVADGYPITFGEMDPAEKHSISHRADAFNQLVAECFR